MSIAFTACSLSNIVGDPASQQNTSNNPDAVKNQAGAIAFYQGVIAQQAFAISKANFASALLSDELRPLGNDATSPYTVLDARQLPDVPSPLDPDLGVFAALNKVRANARQARGVLTAYFPTAPSALQGHLYAIEAMADVLLAELFCSGVPLSTVDYGGDVTLRAGSPTEEVFTTAVALFDSAIALSSDSARILNFAKVGKARALLGSGQYTAVASTVRDVPLDYRYLLEYGITPSTSTSAPLTNDFVRAAPGLPYGNPISVATSSTSEAGNGLPYGNWDWRTDTTEIQLAWGTGSRPPYPVRTAVKYDWNGTTPMILASGIEARLIVAEAALQSGGTAWLDTLNMLRTTCTPNTGCSPIMVSPPTPPSPLPTLLDPGTTANRVDMLFAERAAWLYLTGHREGDMRRLIGQYRRNKDAVYPSGAYPIFGGANTMVERYATDVSIAVPYAERRTNLKYTGCFSREA